MGGEGNLLDGCCLPFRFLVSAYLLTGCQGRYQPGQGEMSQGLVVLVGCNYVEDPSADCWAVVESNREVRLSNSLQEPSSPWKARRRDPALALNL